jgi:energy-coupling factor transporter ATP-binding protein EcfA2
MIRGVELENFKGFVRAEVDLGRITVLIGPNGTGKSSVWQALVLLRQSLGLGGLRVSGPLLNLGTFNDILRKNAEPPWIGIGLRCNTPEAYPALGVPAGAAFSYLAHFEPEFSRFQGQIGVSDKKLLFVRKGYVGQPDLLEPKSLGIHREDGTEVFVPLNIGSELARPIEMQHWPDQESRREGNALLSTVLLALGAIYFVPALRGVESPKYDLLDSDRIDLLPGENAQLASTFAYGGGGLEEIVSIWCEDITGSGISAQLVPGKKVSIQSEVGQVRIPVICDGFGTNQLVSLLLTLAVTPSRSLIAIEEPEIHLHPSSQTKLCKLLLDVTQRSERQILVTTHSQHILFAFLSAVRQGTLPAKDLAIYNFARVGEAPERLVPDDHGDIYDWDRRDLLGHA